MKKLPGDVYPNQPPGDGWNSMGLLNENQSAEKTENTENVLEKLQGSSYFWHQNCSCLRLWDLCYLICVICFWHFLTSFESDQFSLVYVLWEVWCTKTLGHSVPVASNFELVGPETFAGSGSGLGGFAAGCLWRRLAKSGDLSQSFSSLLACVLSWESNQVDVPNSLFQFLIQVWYAIYEYRLSQFVFHSFVGQMPGLDKSDQQRSSPGILIRRSRATRLWMSHCASLCAMKWGPSMDIWDNWKLRLRRRIYQAGCRYTGPCSILLFMVHRCAQPTDDRHD